MRFRFQMPLLGFSSCFRNLSLSSCGVALSLRRDDREQGSTEKRWHDPGRHKDARLMEDLEKEKQAGTSDKTQLQRLRSLARRRGQGEAMLLFFGKRASPREMQRGVYLILLSSGFHCEGRGRRAVSTDKGDQGLPRDLQKAITDKGLSRQGS